MIPGGYQDYAMDFFGMQQLDGKLGILLRGFGVAFNLDYARRNTGLKQQLPVNFIVSCAGNNDARRGLFFK